MKINYITTDFEFESTEDLNPIVQEIGEALVPQLNEWVNENFVYHFPEPAQKFMMIRSKQLSNFVI